MSVKLTSQQRSQCLRVKFRIKCQTLKHKRPWIDKAILGRKNNAGGIKMPNLRLYHRVIGIKTAW
jgi:hypothetical protein